MDYVNAMLSHLRKMDDELIKSDRMLLDLVKELVDDDRNNRRAIDKLEQQVAELRKELADLKKTANE